MRAASGRVDSGRVGSGGAGMGAAGYDPLRIAAGVTAASPGSAASGAKTGGRRYPATVTIDGQGRVGGVPDGHGDQLGRSDGGPRGAERAEQLRRIGQRRRAAQDRRPPPDRSRRARPQHVAPAGKGTGDGHPSNLQQGPAAGRPAWRARGRAGDSTGSGVGGSMGGGAGDSTGGARRGGRRRAVWRWHRGCQRCADRDGLRPTGPQDAYRRDGKEWGGEDRRHLDARRAGRAGEQVPAEDGFSGGGPRRPDPRTVGAKPRGAGLVAAGVPGGASQLRGSRGGPERGVTGARRVTGERCRARAGEARTARREWLRHPSGSRPVRPVLPAAHPGWPTPPPRGVPSTGDQARRLRRAGRPTGGGKRPRDGGTGAGGPPAYTTDGIGRRPDPGAARHLPGRELPGGVAAPLAEDSPHPDRSRRHPGHPRAIHQGGPPGGGPPQEPRRGRHRAGCAHRKRAQGQRSGPGQVHHGAGTGGSRRGPPYAGG